MGRGWKVEAKGERADASLTDRCCAVPVKLAERPVGGTPMEAGRCLLPLSAAAREPAWLGRRASVGGKVSLVLVVAASCRRLDGGEPWLVPFSDDAVDDPDSLCAREGCWGGEDVAEAEEVLLERDD